VDSQGFLNASLKIEAIKEVKLFRPLRFRDFSPFSGSESRLQRQYWRLFTSVFYFGQINVWCILGIYVFITSANGLETAWFSEHPADFLLFWLIGLIFLWIFALNRPVFFLSPGIDFYVLYYWSKRFPDVRLIFFSLTWFTCPAT
jgi:Derlin-2/3